MKKRKFAAPLLTLGLAAGLVIPVQAADEPEKPVVPGEEIEEVVATGIELKKTATLTDDGTYTIDLEAYATGTVETDVETNTKGVPCDIVLVLDQSGSMADPIGQITEYKKNGSASLTYDKVKEGEYYVLYNGNYYPIQKSKKGVILSSKMYALKISPPEGDRYLQGSSIVSTENYVSSKDTVIWTGDVYEKSTVDGPSKSSALIDAVNTFMENVQRDSIENKADHKIAIVGFAGGEQAYDDQPSYVNTELLSSATTHTYPIKSNSYYKDALVSVNQGGSLNPRLTTAVTRYATNGGTHANLGLSLAKGVLNNREEKTFIAPDGTEKDRKQIVIFFTDGYPGNYQTPEFFTDRYDGQDNLNISTANKTITEANELKKKDAFVYTVGLVDGADPEADYKFSVSTKNGYKRYSKSVDAMNAYMHFVSSDFGQMTDMEDGLKKTPTAKGYYVAASDQSSLNSIFEKLSNSISKPIVTIPTVLQSTAVLKDIMSTGFEMTPESTVTVTTEDYNGKDSNGNLMWKNEQKFTGTVNGKDYTGPVTVDKEKKTVAVSGFDYESNYVTDGSPDGLVKMNGKKLNVQITGVIPVDVAITGNPYKTNSGYSGVYASSTSTAPVATFPRPDTILTKQAYVLDYAVTKNDEAKKTLLKSASNVSSTLGKFTETGEEYFGTLATSSSESDGFAVSYTPRTMNWSGYDNFYLFGKSDNPNVLSRSANANGNLWSRVTFIPANNVYYEDDFTVENGASIGIEYSKDGWQKDTKQPEDKTEQTGNANNHGWIDELKLNNGFTGGSASYATVTQGGAKATASFQFTGTGFDIYSKTNNLTGVVTVSVYRTADLEKEKTDTSFHAGAILGKSVNTYAQSGDYYHIPAVHFDMPEHGSYTVKLQVLSAGSDDKVDGVRRATYYIDGIRVYNPIQNLEGEQIVQDAYGDEIKANFTNLRRGLLAKGYKSEFSNVFYIDKHDADHELATYEDIGPNNEIYLSQGKKIGFKVADLNAVYQVGLKTPKGVATVTISDGPSGNSTFTVNSATDMYYSVKPDSDGYIFIENTKNADDSILSITHLKRTKSDEPEVLLTPEVSEIVTQAAVFDSMPVLEYDAPVEKAPEESEPQEPELGGDEENTEDTDDKDPSFGDILKSLFGGFIKLFPPFN